MARPKKVLPGLGWDSQTQSMVIRAGDDWIVSVVSIIFNDRLILTTLRDYPNGWTAAWCYDKGAAAVLAAAVWDPDTEREPVGYKKVAGDSRGKP